MLTFASDTCLAECTDEAGHPVPAGVASSKVLVTNLHNLTQPRSARPSGVPTSPR